jgi:hypothetical protein
MRGKKKNLCKLALSSERLIVYQNKVRGVEVDEPKQDWFSVNMPVYFTRKLGSEPWYHSSWLAATLCPVISFMR